MGMDTKQLKNRIKSVDSTLHLTKAMGLVASAKIRGASDKMQKGRQYADALRNVISRLTASRECEKSVYMEKRSEGKDCLLVIAGDRGLAGGYNANIFRLFDQLEGEIDILTLGKRACERYDEAPRSVERFDYKDATLIAEKICQGFREGIYRSFQIVSTKYISMMSQAAELTPVLPLEKSETRFKGSIIFEPDEMTVLENVMEAYVVAVVMEAVKESFLCEVAARRFAMDSAEKNASQMIESLQHEYNRARQGAITQEITEIVAGSGI